MSEFDNLSEKSGLCPAYRVFGIRIPILIRWTRDKIDNVMWLDIKNEFMVPRRHSFNQFHLS